MNKISKDSVLPDKKTKERNWESISRMTLNILIFLLPIFALPFAFLALDFSKALLFYLAVSLSFLFWLISLLQKGNIKIPKSSLYLSFIVLLIVWFISSFFSLNKELSFIGSGYEIGTFAFFMFLGLFLFLISLLFQSKKNVFQVFFFLFISSIIVFIFQAFQIFYPSLILDLLEWNIFNSLTSNLIGNWNEFAIFFGFIALISVVLLDTLKTKKLNRIFLLIMLFISLIAMILVNFTSVWIIFGLFAFLFMLYILSFSLPELQKNDNLNYSKKFFGITFLVILIVVFVILGKSLVIDLINYLGLVSVEVRPSWASTYHIAKNTLSENILLGSGPNTFLYDWLKFKPLDVNETFFWNTRFESGIGSLPSFVATTGILGGISILAFLFLVIFLNGSKIISYVKEDESRAFLLASFFGSMYLWAFTIFYSSGAIIFILAFLMTGISIAILTKEEKIKVFTIEFFNNAKKGFVSMLIIAVFIIISISGVYLLFQKYWSEWLFTQSVKELNLNGNIEKAESKLVNAVKFDKQDRYYRMLSEIGIIKSQNILLQQDASQDLIFTQFQNVYSSTIRNAQNAVNANSLDPLNFMQLGRVYELTVSLGVNGAEEMAVDSYNKAFQVSPFDPSPLISSARVKLQINDLDSARKFLDSAINIKNDFAPALFLLAQIDESEGKTDEAINKLNQALFIAQNDIGVLFQLGLLYYKTKDFENARLAFEKTVSLNPSYSNARYFLGIIYDRIGMRNEAIGQFEYIENLNPDNSEVKRILNNLYNRRSALAEISPPEEAPEDREELPIEE